MGEGFPVGKLPQAVLAEMIAATPSRDPRVVVGPQVGEDAAVIDFGETYLVAKTDPITFATDQIGWYAVHINANDVATMGAKPKWFLATILLPEGRADRALVDGIFADLRRACEELDITLCGGHTEITHGLDRTILSGQMLGEVAKDRLVVNRNGRPGDAVILTKGIAIEATAILAREKGEELRGRVPADAIERARAFLRSPGLSVVAEALAANEAGGVRAMHDPTEGGLATGAAELAAAADTGILLDVDRVRVFPECVQLCEAFGLDPLGVIASGSLLIVAADDAVPRILTALSDVGVWADRVGALTEKHEGLRMIHDGRERPLPSFPADEIVKVF